MRKVILLLALISSVSSFAQESTFFYSAKPWRANRWYIVGQINDRQIKWWGDGRSPGVNLREQCRFQSDGFEYERVSDDAQYEILQGSGFILIEVDPLQSQEEITLISQSDSSCRLKVNIDYAFGDSVASIKPYLFLKPKGTRYNNREFTVYTPLSSGRSDIQMDILLGYWSANVNRASAGAKSNFQLAPMAIARGEWKPAFVYKFVGFLLEMEQSLAVRGVAKNQSFYLSDMMGGAFLEWVFPYFEGWQLRFTGKVHQHIADDGSGVSTVSQDTEYMFFPVMALSSTVYFGTRYLMGLELSYGIPNEIVVAATGHSLLGGRVNFGIRLTSETFWMFEGGYRQYFEDGGAKDTFLMFNTGVRLEL